MKYSVVIYHVSFKGMHVCGLPTPLAPLCMEFSKPKYWSRLSFTTLGIFLTQGLNFESLFTGGFF